MPHPETSRHTRSRQTAGQQSPSAVLNELRRAVTRLMSRAPQDVLVFTTADPASGVAATSPTMVSTHETRMYRTGNGTTVYADVACGTGAASVMAVQLAVPDLGLTGAPVTTPAAGGAEQVLRATLTLPAAWAVGDGHSVMVQAQRTSGTDATTVRVLRAWQY